MIEYVLDTNVLSELMRERPNAGLEAKLTARRTTCAIPSPVIDELQFGVSRIGTGERQKMYQAWLEALMADFPVIPLDGLCAQWHGRERARLTGIGKPPSLYDGLIASIAAVNELVLVTHNTADFEGFSGITLQDWYEA
jgi:tRNA(fMet)-specific endonuclease VapC